MEVIYINSIEDIRNYGPVSVAHGFFDGVHVAHKLLIEEARAFAMLNDCKVGVVTFDKKMAYKQNKDSFISSLSISTLDRRLDIFDSYEVDIVFVINFENFKFLEAREYIDSVIIKIGTKNFVMGKDNRFGKDGIGNFKNITEFTKNNIEVNVVDLVVDLGDKVSSSQIKKYLLCDDVRKANNLLGHYYYLFGKVTRGKQLGRTIGYPTANLHVNEMVIIPHIGVYATLIRVNGVLHKSVTNIGFNPTTDFRREVSVETYIFDFDENIYDCDAEIYFVARIRDEKKFSNIEELTTQLRLDEKDAINALEYIDNKMII